MFFLNSDLIKLCDKYIYCRPGGPISESACYFRKALQKDNLLKPRQMDFGGPEKKRVIEFEETLEYETRESVEKHESPVR